MPMSRTCVAMLAGLTAATLIPMASATSAAGARRPPAYSSLNCPKSDVPGGPTGCYLVPPGIHKIKHVIIIMQENRSFDSYFGTYPGADGIPMKNGQPTVCVPDPVTKGCVAPFHDVDDINGGGPHGEPDAVVDVNNGQMNGFIQSVRNAASTCLIPNDPACDEFNLGKASGPTSEPDVMGYHTAAEIPNYWAYAKNFVLDDHMFEPVKSWSLPDHLYLVSGWSAKCKNKSPTSCINEIYGPYGVNQFDQAVTKEMATGTTTIDLAWTDLTWLLFSRPRVMGLLRPDGHSAGL